jgi:Cu+-exporting ATPase
MVPGAVRPDDLVAAVEQAGYTAVLPAAAEPAGAEPAGGPQPAAGEQEEAASLRQRLLVSLGLAVPVVVLAMVPAAQFRNWQWASLALASPVAVWGAWPFHRAAFTNARHGAATMDTLISVGVGAATCGPSTRCSSVLRAARARTWASPSWPVAPGPATSTWTSPAG